MYKEKCRARKSLPRHPGTYKRPPKCICGAELKIDNAAMRARKEQKTCCCDGRLWPHRMGDRLCRFEKNGDIKLIIPDPHQDNKGEFYEK